MSRLGTLNIIIMGAVIMLAIVSGIARITYESVSQLALMEQNLILAKYDGGSKYVSQLPPSERLELIKRDMPVELYAEARVSYDQAWQSSEAGFYMTFSGVLAAFAAWGGVYNITYGITVQYPEWKEKKAKAQRTQ